MGSCIRLVLENWTEESKSSVDQEPCFEGVLHWAYVWPQSLSVLQTWASLLSSPHPVPRTWGKLSGH